ncbi:MAG: hypothetical protein NC483_00405 [Ruminococcus sp.]|nr:hypothetical protein [Ruminococcus sp.]
MKEIFTGLIICLVCFLLIDFLYTTKNTCIISDTYGNTEYKCGILKKELDTDIYLFDRYW